MPQNSTRALDAIDMSNIPLIAMNLGVFGDFPLIFVHQKARLLAFRIVP